MVSLNGHCFARFGKGLPPSKSMSPILFILISTSYWMDCGIVPHRPAMLLAQRFRIQGIASNNESILCSISLKGIITHHSHPAIPFL